MRSVPARLALPSLVAATLLAVGLVPRCPVAPASAVSADVVISEVYGGGGNSGSVYTHDFVELENRGSTPVDVTGWSVQYASAAGVTWISTAISGTIPPGGHYLVQEGAAGGGTTPLPAPDAVGAIAMSAASGKVALVTAASALPGCGSACAFQAGVKDFVGYGSANAFEGSPAPGLGNGTSARRVDGPDTDDNAANFTAGPPDPQGSDSHAPSCAGTPVPVGSVQGAADVSPVVGAQVTVRGAVVGDFEGAAPALRGFYLQDDGDGAPATSDGIFVFTADADQVDLGDDVEVTGTAAEFQGQTQLSNAHVEVCGDGAPPDPVDVTLPPASSTALERYEGMLVRFDQTLSVTEHFQLGRFGQVVVSAGGRLAQPTNLYPADDPRSAELAAANALNRLIIDDSLQSQNPDPIVFGRDGEPLSAQNTLRGGDTVTGAVGVLTYTWGGNQASPNAYRLRPVGALGGSARFEAANPRPGGPPSVGAAKVRVASANLLNFFNTFGNACTLGVSGAAAECRGAADSTGYQRQLAKEVAALTSLNADVIGVMELENDGYGPGSAIAALVDALNAAQGAGSWAFVDVDTATGTVNAAGTDAIKVALLYRPGAVTPVAGTTRVEPTAGQFERRPLAQTFETPDGARFSVVVNHFKSKGSCPASGADTDQGDGQSCWNARRTAQAQALAGWVASSVVPAAGDPDVLIIGDLNSYAKEDPILALESAGFTNLVEAYGGERAYSYAFDGQWGYLDHALASSSLVSQVTGATDVHINADEPSVLDYTTDFKSAGQIESLYAPDRFRTSDHDPVVIGLDPVGVREYKVRFVTPQNGWSWIGGLPLPVVFQVLGQDGRPLSRTDAAALVASGSCRVTVRVSGVQSAPDRCPVHERATNTFATVWTPKRTPKGAVFVEVSIRYPASSVVTHKVVPVRIA